MNEAGFERQDTRGFMSSCFAALFGSGGLLVAITLLLPHPGTRYLPGMLFVVGAAAAVTSALLLWGTRLPPRLFYALPPLGSGLVSLCSLWGGSGTRVAYSCFFFWAIASAFYLFPRRAALLNVPLVAGLYAAVMLTGDEPYKAIRYFLPVAAMAVSALLLDQLNQARHRLNEEIESMIGNLDEMARTDPLTDLANRREFERQLQRDLARTARGGRPLSVLIIDLDHFKGYNDTHGHLAGDQMLRATARAWERRLRSGDLLARYGGEEFAAVLPECALEHAEQLAERLRLGVPMGLTCSIGVAGWDGEESSHALIRRADDALLAAKRLGRDQTRLAETPRPVPAPAPA